MNTFKIRILSFLFAALLLFAAPAKATVPVVDYVTNTQLGALNLLVTAGNGILSTIATTNANIYVTAGNPSDVAKAVTDLQGKGIPTSILNATAATFLENRSSSAVRDNFLTRDARWREMWMDAQFNMLADTNYTQQILLEKIAAALGPDGSHPKGMNSQVLGVIEELPIEEFVFNKAKATVDSMVDTADAFKLTETNPLILTHSPRSTNRLTAAATGLIPSYAPAASSTAGIAAIETNINGADLTTQLIAGNELHKQEAFPERDQVLQTLTKIIETYDAADGEVYPSKISYQPPATQTTHTPTPSSPKNNVAVPAVSQQQNYPAATPASYQTAFFEDYQAGSGKSADQCKFAGEGYTTSSLDIMNCIPDFNLGDFDLETGLDDIELGCLGTLKIPSTFKSLSNYWKSCGFGFDYGFDSSIQIAIMDCPVDFSQYEDINIGEVIGKLYSKGDSAGDVVGNTFTVLTDAGKEALNNLWESRKKFPNLVKVRADVEVKDLGRLWLESGCETIASDQDRQLVVEERDLRLKEVANEAYLSGKTYRLSASEIAAKNLSDSEVRRNTATNLRQQILALDQTVAEVGASIITLLGQQQGLTNELLGIQTIAGFPAVSGLPDNKDGAAGGGGGGGGTPTSPSASYSPENGAAWTNAAYSKSPEECKVASNKPWLPTSMLQ